MKYLPYIVRTVKHRIEFVERAEPNLSSFVVFGRAIEGQKYSNRSIREWFASYVDKDDYDSSNRMEILRHFNNLTNLETEYDIGSYRKKFAEMPEYREWRLAVLQRDRHKCTNCESRTQLEVDHIKPFLYIKIKYRIETREDARNCPDMWDISNGRVLCNSCHKKTKTYGPKAIEIALEMLSNE